MISSAVHTTGVNWEGVLAVTASVTVILTAFTGLIVRSMKAAIRGIIATDVTPVLDEIRAELRSHDTRLAKLEGIEEGKSYAIKAAGVTTIPGGR